MSKINQDSGKHHGNKKEVIKDLWGYCFDLIFCIKTTSKINQDSGKHQEDEEEVIKDDLWDRGLPSELLELILSKLIFVVDIKKFQAVCKTWRSINIPPPRQLPSPLPYADSSCPLLFQIMGFPTQEKHYKYRILHPLYNYTWDMDFPPQVSDGPKRIYFSKYGWSLMTRFFMQPFLFNPLTQEMIKLPTMPIFPWYSPCMLFTCPPSQPDCLVVAISGLDGSIYVHKLGEADWKKHDLKGRKMDLNFPRRLKHKSMIDCSFRPICHPILYQGLCCCLDWKRRLVVFDIQDIEHSWKEVFIPSPCMVSAHLTALVEHNGQLLVVVFGDGTERPCIFKLDLKRKLHVKMESLGKNALFISEGASFSQRAIVSGIGNKVFVPFLKKYTDFFRFYSLAIGKYHSFFDNLSSNDFRDMEFLPNSSWLPM
ncbi:hypothetical protein COLO4_14641 [Corchorus olitorius]|uniref:KIB1-4 beta-propeller domain-containing protein n=1 Tax=Corchorus olitorius TaxID=93759 RepID=A0A1R3JRL4_9ROSI|nr:hypothetical protein COLO4_14641 [Corchorus olitorius]